MDDLDRHRQQWWHPELCRCGALHPCSVRRAAERKLPPMAQPYVPDDLVEEYFRQTEEWSINQRRYGA